MSVRVVARIRPLLKAELDKDTIVSADSAGEGQPATIVRIPNPRNEGEAFSFQFNSVYGSEATQQQVFDGEVAPTVKHLFNGFDVTLFAYGVTGTGKTHTMRGGKMLADRGVIPRLLSGIYRRGRRIEKDAEGQTQVAVSMSYYEIYNDKVFDLFEAPEKRTAAGLPLRDAGGKTVVVGLTERPCESLKDFEKLYDQANLNRSTSATKLNAHSSRSHAVLCVRITITKGDETRISTASAIDLAGSEDNRRTENSKERLVESSSINKSLFVLASCVEAISRKASRIPYRESKMTRILSLGQNNGLTIMILNLAPVRSYHLDTLSSLNFANRTKKIEVREVENEPIFMGCARPVAVGVTLQRQPLRPLANAVHNANVRKATDVGSKPNSKPAKAFSVYADTTRGSTNDHRGGAVKRSSPLKRPSDPFMASGRPQKAARPSPFSIRRPEPAISKASIEDMVEKKVSEILAARALDKSVPPPTTEISDEVKRRLELLEQKIEGQDDSRAEGLSYLLMAKQHHARGEQSSALKMYELAREHFPDNAKLEAKITKLKESLQEKKRAELEVATASFRRPVEMLKEEAAALQQYHQARPRKPKHCSSREYDDDADADYQDNANHAYSDDEDDYYNNTSNASSKSKPQPKTKLRKQHTATAKSFPVALDININNANNNNYHDYDYDAAKETHPQTPRTRHLLSIINTRDVAAIRLLRGVGPKKAEAIVEALAAAAANADNGLEVGVSNLEQLGRLRGVGSKTVEGMRVGLG